MAKLYFWLRTTLAGKRASALSEYIDQTGSRKDNKSVRIPEGRNGIVLDLSLLVALADSVDFV